MKFFLRLMSCFLILLSCNQGIPDEELVKFIEEGKIEKAKQDFLDRNIKSIVELESDSGCNRLVKRYLVKDFSDNTDSLKKCAEILTESIYNKVLINEQSCGAVRPRGGVFLYSSQKKYNLGAPFASYSKSFATEIHGTFIEYNLK